MPQIADAIIIRDRLIEDILAAWPEVVRVVLTPGPDVPDRQVPMAALHFSGLRQDFRGELSTATDVTQSLEFVVIGVWQAQENQVPQDFLIGKANLLIAQSEVDPYAGVGNFMLAEEIEFLEGEEQDTFAVKLKFTCITGETY